MSTKMKGLLKGLRYISQIFDEEKESEMQIGFPTDVKHVAHIGWDGPSVDSPSWMNEYKSPTGFQSAPLSSPGDPREDPEIKWVSQDSRRGSSRAITDSPSRDLPELPKSSRRHSSTENNTNESPKKKDSSTKSRQPRRNQSKESSDASLKSNRQLQESSLSIDSPPRNLPDVPKKSRRKKSKESITSGGGSSRARSKGTTTNGTHLDVPPCSDPGHDNGSILQMPGSGSINSTSSSKSVIQDDQEKESSVISKEY